MTAMPTALDAGGWRAVTGVREALDRARSRPGGRTYSALRWAGAAAFLALLAGLIVTVAIESGQAFARWGVGFVWSGTCAPGSNQYAAGLLIVGTIVTTFAAMAIVVPVGLGVSVFLSEQAPRWIAAPLSTAIDLLAAVPSIVVGLWALLVLSPVFARHVEPFLHHLPVLGFVFHGFSYGPSIILAAVVLAVMSLPSVVTLSRTALSAVPAADREAAMALGATCWQVVRRAVLPAARSGIAAALTLAVGRALGESIAVAMVIGNRPGVPHSLLAPGATLGSAIVNNFAEAAPGLGTSSVIAHGAVLRLRTLLVNLGGQALLRRGAPTAPPARGAPALPRRPAVGPFPTDVPAGPPAFGGWDPEATARLRARLRVNAPGSLTRRRAAGGAMQVLCAAAAVVGAAPLVALVGYTLARGAKAVSWTFLTHAPTPPGLPGGGVYPALVGSAKIAGLGLGIAAPVGLFTALFVYERRGRLAGAIRFGAEVMTGVPSIIVGIFAYALLVRPLHHFGLLPAAFAISVLMTPIMIRANAEAMRSVDVDLWEAGVALGARRSRVARAVVLRGALPGILSANLLAVARGIGETAPLLFTVAAPTMAATLFIYSQGTEAIPSAQTAAWGTALVVLAAVLVLSVATRLLSWALTRKAG